MCAPPVRIGYDIPQSLRSYFNITKYSYKKIKRFLTIQLHSKFGNGVNRKCASLAVYKHIDYYEIGGNGFKTFPPIQTLAQPYFIVN